MANWKLIEHRVTGNKRYVKIRDIVNDREYDNYFLKSVVASAIKNRFVTQVKEHRAEIAAKQAPINLDNFEALL